MGRGSGAVTSGHGEGFGIAGCAAAWSRRAVAVAGQGRGVAVADAAGVVIDFLLMRVKGALARDFIQVLRPPVCQVDVFGVCGVFWYQIAVAECVVSSGIRLPWPTGGAVTPLVVWVPLPLPMEGVVVPPELAVEVVVPVAAVPGVSPVPV